MVFLSIAGVLAVMAGLVVIFVSHGGTRWVGVAMIVGAAVSWLFAILPYLAAQAMARYIEYRTDLAP